MKRCRKVISILIMVLLIVQCCSCGSQMNFDINECVNRLNENLVGGYYADAQKLDSSYVINILGGGDLVCCILPFTADGSAKSEDDTITEILLHLSGTSQNDMTKDFAYIMTAMMKTCDDSLSDDEMDSLQEQLLDTDNVKNAGGVYYNDVEHNGVSYHISVSYTDEELRTTFSIELE